MKTLAVFVIAAALCFAALSMFGSLEAEPMRERNQNTDLSPGSMEPILVIPIAGLIIGVIVMVGGKAAGKPVETRRSQYEFKQLLNWMVLIAVLVLLSMGTR